MKILKKDGRYEDFNFDKLTESIYNAILGGRNPYKISTAKLNNIKQCAYDVAGEVAKSVVMSNNVTTDFIRVKAESAMMKLGYYEAAVSYITYCLLNTQRKRGE